jgi:hypothetical protein
MEWANFFGIIRVYLRATSVFLMATHDYIHVRGMFGILISIL